MTRSRFSPSLPSLSLAAQLLLTFVGLVAGTTVVLTIAAYRTSLSNLEDEARRSVTVAAEARAQTLTQLLTYRQQRAQGFLAGAEAICAEPAGPRGFGWSENCVRDMIASYRSTENAIGAIMTFRGRRLTSAGRTTAEVNPEPGALAVVVRRPDGGADFLLQAVRGDTTLTAQFDSREILEIFGNRSGLGSTGEVYLADRRGEFLTPARYTSTTDAGDAAIASRRVVTPAGARIAEPFEECRRGPGVKLGLDYRGVETVHGFTPVPALGGACIDAHISYAEALGPAEAQSRELVERGAMFALIGAVLSLFAAQWIAAPVRRLAESARALQAGDFGGDVPIAGPSDVRALGRAFAAMADDLAKLVTREQAARREAEAANRSKDQFLAMLSHELRTPLNAILGWARLLKNSPQDPNRTRRATDAIERSAEAQQRLIEDLLDVSRIVSGRLRMVRSPTRLDVVTEAALDAVRPRAAEKGVRIETNIGDTDLPIMGDAQRLQQVVWNLTWNGVKFTPPGGWVRVQLRRLDGSAELEISDSGVGIDPAFLPHVFEWFRQANLAERPVEAGLGLGLGLVRQIVERHGGTVRAASAGKGQGATFTVTLPLHGSDAAAATVESEVQGETTDAEMALQSLNVLLVDDDAESRGIAREVLEHAGATVQMASSAAQAREMLATCASDVLIFDIAMPGEDGYALMRSLRDRGMTTPAIALTSYARKEDAEKSRAAGFEVHMTKPIDPFRLVSIVAALARPRAST